MPTPRLTAAVTNAIRHTMYAAHCSLGLRPLLSLKPYAPGPLHRGLCPSVFRVPITGLDTGSQRITWDFDPTATSGPTTQNPLYVKKKQEHKSLFVFCLREWTIEFCQQCKAKSLFAVFPSQSGPASLPTGWRRTSTAYMPFPFRRQRSKLSTTFVRTLR